MLIMPSSYDRMLNVYHIIIKVFSFQYIYIYIYLYIDIRTFEQIKSSFILI